MIRWAKNEDIPKIVEFGQLLHDESSYAHTSFNKEKLADFCLPLITHGFAMVAEKDGQVIGGMLGDVYAPFYTDDLCGVDHSLYILPAHRNGIIALKLIRAFISWCKEMKATQIRNGIGTGNPAVARLYEAFGFKLVGGWFLMDI